MKTKIFALFLASMMSAILFIQPLGEGAAVFASEDAPGPSDVSAAEEFPGAVDEDDPDDDPGLIDDPDQLDDPGAGPECIIDPLEYNDENAFFPLDAEEGIGALASTNQAFINEVVRLVNNERAKVKKPPLAAWYPGLNNAANVRAKEIVKKFDHVRPNGTWCYTVLPECGVPEWGMGENIAAGYTTPAAVVKGWMDSPGHRSNILDTNNLGYNFIGVGHLYDSGSVYGHHWVQLFLIVPPNQSTAVSLNKSSMKVRPGKTASLSATMTPVYSADKIVWTSSNTSVATVSASGTFNTAATVKGLTDGTATITATSRAGVSSSCAVSVVSPPFTISTIQGVIPPVRGKQPAPAITSTAQFTGTITWSPEITGGVFDADTEYTATVTLVPKKGYGLQELRANFFKIAGALSVTNDEGSGVVTAVFPATAELDATVGQNTIPLAAPVADEAPVTAFTTDQYSGKVTWSPSVSGVFSGKTAYTATIALTPKPGFTLEGVPAGFFEAEGADSAAYDAGGSVITAIYPETGFAAAATFSVTPSHIILSRKNDSAVISAVLPPSSADFDNIAWHCGENDDVAFSHPDGPSSITVELTAEEPVADTVAVEAVYTYKGKEYTASSTIELLPAGRIHDETTVIFLEKKITVNKALLIGARLPVLITEQSPSDLGITAFGSQPVSALSAGSVLIDDVALFTKNNKTGLWTVPLTTYEARMCPSDDRYIEFNALPGAKDTNNVRIKLLPAGEDPSFDDNWIEADGAVNISVVEKYPKITLKAGELNQVFRDAPATLTATSGGSPCAIIGIKAQKPANEGKVEYSDGKLSIGSMTNAATIPIKVKVDLPHYKDLPEKNWPLINIKVVNALPKLKLSAKTLTLSGHEDIAINLLSNDSKRTLESYGAIEKITLNGGSSDLFRHGKIYVPGETKAGAHKVNVRFAGASKAVNLNLTIKVIALDKITISSKTKSIVVHGGHAAGTDIAGVTITPNVHNVTVSDWFVKGLPSGIAYTSGPNSLAFKVTGPLAATKKAVTLEINSPSMQFKKPVKISLTITNNAPKCVLTVKGNIDIANPKSKINATAKLTNTTSAIDEVMLSGTGSECFAATVTGANAFSITCLKGTVPGIKRTLTVNVRLKNDQTVKATKTIVFTPKQTVGKASQSAKNITLYKAAPLTGSTVGLNLTTPQNVKLSYVRVNEASVNAMKFDRDLPNNGFEVKRIGEKEWTVFFKNGRSPVPAKGKLKASYVLKLELWADGTYETDEDGGFMDCLRDANGKAKSKPKIIPVRVYIK